MIIGFWVDSLMLDDGVVDCESMYTRISRGVAMDIHSLKSEVSDIGPPAKTVYFFPY